MTRSRQRKLKRIDAQRARTLVKGVPLASVLLAGVPQVFAQQPQPQDASGLEEVIVSAQKRDESLQTVPLSIQAIATARLEELHVTDFNDYAKFLPSVAFNTTGPGFAQVYMRGVASGNDGNHSGSSPSVGMYLDEQPITTIQGALDIHVYDIARVEALSGPQGTLYGASSQAGTIRIITNKPDPSGFSASYDLEGNMLSQGTGGYTAEGYVNIPITEKSAIRLVGWKTREGGYIDNVHRVRDYSTGVSADNASAVKKNYNPVDTYGARAALKVDLNDNWTITPTLMGQKQTTDGVFSTDNTVGELQVAHQFPENSSDRWGQAALTVEGRFSNFDIVYAGAYLKRNDEVNSDYADYSFFYDVNYGFASYIVNNDGEFVDPGQFIQGKDRYTRYSQELRISSPGDWKVRYVGGLFMQRQEHSIEQRYLINDLADNLSVTGWPNTLWLTEQMRTDRDYAIFGEVTWDVTEKISLTGGLRFFKAKNSLDGFFGFGITNIYDSATGEQSCDPALGGPFRGAPCTNLRKTTDEKDHIHKLNASYRIADDKMVYFTWSKGFRPGGINRNGDLPPYTSDFLTNYEVGWKTSWLNNRLRFNGAAFIEDWKDFQFSILGGNGLTEIKNANQARIKGVESDLSFAVTPSLRLTAGAAYLDSKLTANYCGYVDENLHPETNCPAGTIPPGSDEPVSGPEAVSGQQLPVTPKFKGNLTARYSFPVGTLNAYVQGAAVYTGARWGDLRTVEREIIGRLPSYTLADFSVGVARENFTLDLFVNNAFDRRADLFRFAECAESICGPEIYTITNQPRTIGVRFGQKF